MEPMQGAAPHKPGEARDDFLLRAGAWLLVLYGSFANLLNYHDYPLLTPEVLVVALGLFGVGAVMALVHMLSAPRLSFLMTGILIGFAVDLNDIGEWPVILGATAGGIAAAYLFDRVILKLLCAAFAAVAVFQLASVTFNEGRTPTPTFTPAAQSPRAAGPPPLVHVVFDAYLGMSGMRDDEASFSDLRRRNEDFFRARGFRLFGGAYSEHRDTANAIPAMLSFDRAPFAKDSPEARKAPPALEYFIRLERLGYRTHVLRTDYLNLCTNQPIAACTSPPLSHMLVLRHIEMSTIDRAKVIATVLLGMTELPHEGLNRFLQAPNDAAPPRDALLISLTALESLGTVEQMLGDIRSGDAVVAHIILPHDPFVLDADCRLQPRNRWRVAADPTPRGAREAAYGLHMRCALKSLDRLLAVLDRTPEGQRAVVIVHGDHGSRMVDHIPRTGVRGLTTRDFAMTYSTVFAIRAPQIAPGYDPSPAPVSYLLDELSGTNFSRLPPPYQGSRHVFLADREWVPREKVALPPFGLTTN